MNKCRNISEFLPKLDRPNYDKSMQNHPRIMAHVSRLHFRADVIFTLEVRVGDTGTDESLVVHFPSVAFRVQVAHAQSETDAPTVTMLVIGSRVTKICWLMLVVRSGFTSADHPWLIKLE